MLMVLDFSSYEMSLMLLLVTFMLEVGMTLSHTSTEKMTTSSIDHPCNYDGIIREETPQAERIARYFKERNWLNVLDVGCGPGIYVKAMRELGMNAHGVDIDPRAATAPFCTIEDIVVRAHMPWLCANFVLSLEVGEHIPEKHSWDYIRYIRNCEPKLVVFSAAQPGQGGDGHINCQPRSYWCSRFNWHGYVYDAEQTARFVDYMKSGYHMGWLVNNVMIFKRQLKGYRHSTPNMLCYPDESKSIFNLGLLSGGSVQIPPRFRHVFGVKFGPRLFHNGAKTY
jgi:hypothetical protein